MAEEVGPGVQVGRQFGQQGFGDLESQFFKTLAQHEAGGFIFAQKTVIGLP